MDLDAFRRSLAQAEPPQALSLAARGLWWDAKGDWDKAHGCAQEQDDEAGAPGCTPICTARKATRPMPAIGIAAPARRPRPRRSPRSGKRSRAPCSRWNSERGDQARRGTAASGAAAAWDAVCAWTLPEISPPRSISIWL